MESDTSVRAESCRVRIRTFRCAAQPQSVVKDTISGGQMAFGMKKRIIARIRFELGIVAASQILECHLAQRL